MWLLNLKGIFCEIHQEIEHTQEHLQEAHEYIDQVAETHFQTCSELLGWNVKETIGHKGHTSGNR